MKITLSILVLFSLGLNSIYCDPCGEITNCPKKKYCYKFCDTHPDFIEQFELCVEDPMNHGGVDDIKPMKLMDHPICLSYEESGIYPSTIRTPLLTGEIETYNVDYIETDLDYSEYNWNCICGWEDEECQCTVKVRFSNNPRDFSGNIKYRIAEAKFSWWLGNCELKCSSYQPYIYINGSKEFAGEINGYRQISFINQEYYDNDENYTEFLNPDYKLINITDVITHEMGHQYGLAHQDCCPPPDNTYEGIMDADYTRLNESKQSLSIDDICMFKKLYCPDLVPVKERIVKEETEVYNYPNPIEDVTRLTFTVPQKGANVKIIVYDQLGREVNVLVKRFYSGGDYDKQIDLSGLSSGLYYYTVQIGNDTKTGKMVIGE